MIITKLQGGLGNQMFQYSVGRHLAYLNKTNLKLDISSYNKQNKNDTPRKYSLNNFNIIESFSEEKDNKKLNIPDTTSKNIFIRIYRKIFKKLQTKKPIYKRTFIKEPFFGYCNEILKIRKNAYLDGNWQNEKYFKNISNIIYKDFTLKHKSANYQNQLLKILNVKISISLHVRRGDYINNKMIKKYRKTCYINYYKNATDLIAKNISTPTFFIFSDDIEWVKKNLKTNHKTIFVSGNQLKDYEELILMSRCKHNIISNSSFSWWGAWLNQNPNKTIIAPKKWFNAEDRQKDNPCPANWIKL